MSVITLSLVILNVIMLSLMLINIIIIAIMHIFLSLLPYYMSEKTLERKYNKTCTKENALDLGH